MEDTIRAFTLVSHICLKCRNLNIRFMNKCGVQGPMEPKKCV